MTGRTIHPGLMALTAALAVVSATLLAQGPAPAPAAAPAAPAAPVTRDAPNGVRFYGSATGAISSGAIIPPGHAALWLSGTTPPVVKADAPAGSRERFGDTRTQAAGILKNFETQLKAQGLTLADVVYLRAYLVPDKDKENRIDTAGWNAAYGEMFNTAANPTRPARSTVGVLALVNPDWLIEVEAFAVFPAGKPAK